MNNKKNPQFSVTVVEHMDDPDKKLASFHWQFVSNSLGVIDYKVARNMGIEIYEETECIDERAAAQTIMTGRIRIENNCPGGGFDYFTKEDIRAILLRSEGLVVLDPHRSCGWGGIRLNFYINYKKEISKPIDGTTMVIPSGVTFANGIDYIHYLIADSFVDSNFLNSVMRSARIQREYNFRQDFERALQEAFAKDGQLVFKDSLHQELLELAFVYAKLKELKVLFDNEARTLGLDFAHIRLNPDLLFDQPTHHVAAGAVLNIGKRRLLRRFPLESAYPESFFVDVDMGRMFDVLDVIVNILEGGHSLTNDKSHQVYIVCTARQLNDLQEVVKGYIARRKINSDKEIFIHLIEDDERPKSQEEILALVR